MDWSLNEENLLPSNSKDKYFWQNVCYKNSVIIKKKKICTLLMAI